ncbi:hypothetical protein [Amycolatopsis sp. A1MSW2902]|uniref:hypothetical protein n=1 Tax=Amycolatopsis sp. A1MSW2902 TaxID=687413 RepID=UPI00307DCDEA
MIAAFLQIGAVAMPILVQLTGGLGAAGERFRAFVQQAAESGQLQEWSRSAIAGFQSFFAVIKDLAAIFNAVVGAIMDAGGGLGGFLGPLIKTVREFLESAQGHDTLVAFFESLNSVAGSVSKVVGALLAAIAPAIPPLAAAFASLASTLSTHAGSGHPIPGAGPAKHRELHRAKHQLDCTAGRRARALGRSSMGAERRNGREPDRARHHRDWRADRDRCHDHHLLGAHQDVFRRPLEHRQGCRCRCGAMDLATAGRRVELHQGRVERRRRFLRRALGRRQATSLDHLGIHQGRFLGRLGSDQIRVVRRRRFLRRCLARHHQWPEGCA